MTVDRTSTDRHGQHGRPADGVDATKGSGRSWHGLGRPEPTTLGRDMPVGARQVIALVAWVHLYLVGTLALWVLAVVLVTGWRPVVLTTGSMSPALRPGDVVLIAVDNEEPIGQGSVVTFRRSDDRQTITHRVFAVIEGGRLVTKGDANPTPDTDRVDRSQIVGVGRLVIPVVGLPMVWFQGGNLLPLLAFSLLTITAAFVVGRALVASERNPSLFRASTPLIERAIRRVRTLSVLIVTGQFIFDRQRLEGEVLGVSQVEIVVFVLTCLIGTNLASSSLARNTDRRFGRFDADSLTIWVGLAVDTVVVVLLTALTGGSGIGWVMMALPIIEAAIRFRLTGALAHWLAMGVVTVLARLWILDRAGASVDEFMNQLDYLLDQFGVLLLVAVPGAYLAEQLAGDVAVQAKATDRATQRGRHLEHVADIGRRVNRLGAEDEAGRAGAELFSMLAASTAELGFDAADVWVRRGGRSWLRAARGVGADSGRLPSAGRAGSGLRSDDLEHSEVVVDQRDDDPDERAAIDDAGFSRLIRITLATLDETIIALRVADSGEGGAGDAEALRLLCAQATVALQNNKLLSDLQTMHDELEHQATHDSLTNLPNRKWFMARLRNRLSRPQIPGRVDAVMFLDLNGFKQVNDTMGHEAGDELLIAVSNRLGETVEPHGDLARLGGDEFTILLEPMADVGQVRELASRIHAVLTEPFDLGSGRARVGTSIGIALREPSLDDTELLRRADAAMYAAKTAGGDVRTAYYKAALDEGERRRGRLVAEFRRAFENDEIDVAYQPVVSTLRGRIEGVEALLRWTHRELGPIDTETTLELAEEAQLSSHLNRWILERTTQTLRSVAPDEKLYLAVNLSPVELGSDSLLVNITDALALSGMPANRLVIELSERLVSDDRSQLGNIRALAELGVVLALDDFGEGRTSLAHLRGLPISQLKIDRRLVQNACVSDVDRTILRSVTELAHELSLEVVAEGIETGAQRSVMAELGIGLVQGYGLFRPLSADQLRRLLRSGGEGIERIRRTVDDGSERKTGG